MIETLARVLATEQEFAWVEPRPHSPRGEGGLFAGCRVRLAACLFGSAKKRLRVHNPLGAEAGDWVTISLPRRGALKSALPMYLAPLAGLFAGAALGAQVSTPASVAAGLLGFSLSLLAVRRFARRHRHSALFQPIITAKFPSEPFMLEKTCRSKN